MNPYCISVSASNISVCKQMIVTILDIIENTDNEQFINDQCLLILQTIAVEELTNVEIGRGKYYLLTTFYKTNLCTEAQLNAWLDCVESLIDNYIRVICNLWQTNSHTALSMFYVCVN
jgi:hypothetical protein